MRSSTYAGAQTLAKFLLIALLTPFAASQSNPDFPAFVWRLQSPGQALAEKLVQAFGGVNVEGPHAAEWARAQGLDFYVGHGPGRNTLHIDTDRPWYTEVWQNYWDKRDANVLLRKPCLSEPATMQQLRTRLAKTLAARDGDHGLGVSLGDEVGLTPYGAPLDLCTSAACRAGFEVFLREHPTWSFLLPEEGSAVPYPDTDSTRLAWIDGDPQHVGAWLARRAYHHEVLAKVLGELATQVQQAKPPTAVGLFGQSGRSAFADVGVEQVFDQLDFMEVYRLLDSRELLYTRRRTSQRSYLTVFPEADAPHAPAQVAFEHWMRGGNGLVLWSDRELEQQAGYFERMSNVVGTLRTLRSQWPTWQPQPTDVAVLHSPDSLALSWLRDALRDGPTWMKRYPSYHNQHGTREVSLQGILRALEDCGVLPGALPIAEVNGQTGARFPLLVANQLILLEKHEEELLRSHLDAGHQLLVVGEFAVYDRRGNRPSRDLYEQLRKAYPDSVARMEWDGKRYLEERSVPGRSYPESVRSQLNPRLPEQAGPRWSIRAVDGPSQNGGRSWLQVRQHHRSEEVWMCAALPNGTREEDRRALADQLVELQLESPWTVTWIHPPQALTNPGGPFLLPAGEPAVFELSMP